LGGVIVKIKIIVWDWPLVSPISHIR